MPGGPPRAQTAVGGIFRRTKEQRVLDKMKDMAGNVAGGGGMQDMLKGINFPASKDEVINQLQQKGVPSQVLDQLRGDTSQQFNRAEDVMAKVQQTF
jgi:hypothetical protein